MRERARRGVLRAGGRGRRGCSGLGRVRARTPAVMTWMSLASMRRVTRCPTRWIPALTCLPPTPTHPPAPTRRWTSTMASAGSGPGGRAVAGDGRAGLPPAARSRVRSLSSRVTGWVLISCPSQKTCRVEWSRRRMTFCPASGLPSQTCRPAANMFPLAGTTRSTSTARSPLAVVAGGAGAGPAGRAARLGGSRSARSWSCCCPAGEALAVKRLAGVAMSSDWCGRSRL